MDAQRAWTRDAIAEVQREAARSADTHLLRLDLDRFPGIPFYFKDEAAHPTGSLKHRLARSLFLLALCSGRLRAGQAVVDASSGSTAISEAWFARMLGLKFIAVMPACTAPRKIAEVRAAGGTCDLVEDPTGVHARAAWHAANGACHLDQFGLADQATDWRGNNNIAESILRQMELEPTPEPAWIVCGRGPAARRRRSGAICVIAGSGRGCALPIQLAVRLRKVGARATRRRVRRARR